MHFATRAFQILNSHSCCHLPKLLSAPLRTSCRETEVGGGGGFIFGLSWLWSYGSSGVLLYRGNVASNVFMLIQTSVSTFFKPPYKALKFKPESTPSVSSPRPEELCSQLTFAGWRHHFFKSQFIDFFSLTKWGHQAWWQCLHLLSYVDSNVFQSFGSSLWSSRKTEAPESTARDTEAGLWLH